MYIYIIETVYKDSWQKLDEGIYWELSEDLLDSPLTLSPGVSYWNRLTIDNTAGKYHVYYQYLEGAIAKYFGSYESLVVAVYVALQNLKKELTWRENIPEPDLQALESALQEYT